MAVRFPVRTRRGIAPTVPDGFRWLLVILLDPCWSRAGVASRGRLVGENGAGVVASSLGENKAILGGENERMC